MFRNDNELFKSNVEDRVKTVHIVSLPHLHGLIETEELMPLTVVLSHKLNKKMAELRRNGGLPWSRPDSKTQVD